MIAVIIPTLNEAENLRVLIPLIHNELCLDYKIVIVDDNSSDGTLALLSSMSYPIEVISRPSKLGYASAIIEGIKSVGDADILVQMDADLSHSPRYLKKMIDSINEYDVIIGSRYNNGGVEGIKFHRKLISMSGNYIARKLLGIEVKDCTSGFRVYKKDVFDIINLDMTRIVDGYGFLIMVTELLSRHKMKVKEFPIVFEDRYNGKSKISKWIIIEALILVILLAVQRKMKRG